ncbi:hypothetical protein LJR143_003003 [Pseudoxanthomonas sp. LjRoot143]|uniref:hypothetical protein n=1 Tax=Pseudoxanthomonas sp. LjRoot143 TaxID=3342266 RepID=UPI003ECCC351
MDADLIVMTALTLLTALGMVVAVLLPAWIAWGIAWRSRMCRTQRRSFAFTCLLLTYGVVMFTGALLLPLETLKIFIAPDLHGRGYVTLAKGIFVAAGQGTSIMLIVVGVIAAVVIPLKLRRRWSAITEALAENAVTSPGLDHDGH